MNGIVYACACEIWIKLLWTFKIVKRRDKMVQRKHVFHVFTLLVFEFWLIIFNDIYLHIVTWCLHRWFEFARSWTIFGSFECLPAHTGKVLHQTKYSHLAIAFSHMMKTIKCSVAIKMGIYGSFEPHRQWLSYWSALRCKFALLNVYRTFICKSAHISVPRIKAYWNFPTYFSSEIHIEIGSIWSIL